jgi:hypothetical protein
LIIPKDFALFYYKPFAFILMCSSLLVLVFDFVDFKIIRPVKNFLRQLLGLSSALFIIILISSPIWIKFLSIVMMVIAFFILKQRKKRKKNNLCLLCKEFQNNQNTVCSGYSEIIKAEIDFSKKASEYIYRKYV